MEKRQPPPYDHGFNNQQYEHYNPEAPPPQQHTPYPYGPQGAAPYNPQVQAPSYAPATPAIMSQPAPSMTSTTVVVNSGGLVGCPACHNNSWTGSYSCCAIMWLICCFPIGIICCCCMRKKKCAKCGYTVG